MSQPEFKHRQSIRAGSKWEVLAGCVMAIRVGPFIEIGGTHALDEEQVMFPNDAYNQTQFILLRIQQALEDLGASLNDVVRTRIFTTDMEQQEEIAKAHAEVFQAQPPVMSLVEVYALIQSGLVVEIEATAIIQA